MSAFPSDIVEPGCGGAAPLLCPGDYSELSVLRKKLDSMRRQVSMAEAAQRDAVARAEKAERAERQIAAERDRWKRLCLSHEAELRSLVPLVKNDPGFAQ